jgi:hypothetical protein
VPRGGGETRTRGRRTVVGVALPLEPEMGGGERGGPVRETAMWVTPGSGAQRPVQKEFNSKFQTISNKFKTVQA